MFQITQVKEELWFATKGGMVLELSPWCFFLIALKVVDIWTWILSYCNFNGYLKI